VNLLTPEVQACVGQTVDYVAPEPLGRASIRYFALALGDRNPLWVDDEFARAQGWPGVVAPPTLVCETCQYSREGPDEDGYLGHTWRLPFPEPCQLLRGGNDYRFAAPATPETVLHVRWELLGLEAKAAFVVARAQARYRDQFGELLATNDETTIFRPARRGTDAGPGVSRPAEGGRHGPADDAGDAPAVHASPPAGAEALPDLVRTPTLTDLVAYGAATWDWHRLHYDTAYATAAGLGGPIVDGQLWGALMALHVLDWAGPTARLERLALRYRGVVTAGETVTLRAWAGASDITHEVRAGERLVATGTSRLSPPDRP
jgi:acyl dehydratase